jgi:hypothetical protein
MQGKADLSGLFAIIIVIFGVWGWCWNVVKIVEAWDAPLSVGLVVRIIGVPAAPLGAIVGFF